MYYGTRNILEFTEFKNSPGFSRFLHFQFSHKTKKWVIFRVFRGLFGFLFFHFLAYPGSKQHQTRYQEMQNDLGNRSRPSTTLEMASLKSYWQKTILTYPPPGCFLQIHGKNVIGLVVGRNISYPMYFGTRNNLEFTELRNSPAFSRFLQFQFSHKTKK